MRRPLAALASILAVAALSGCPKKWQNGECETSENCRDQVGYGKICVQGQCQECGQDADCKAGFVCRANKCQPRPECEGPADCAVGQACQAGKCVAAAPAAECGPDAGGRSCGAAQECVAGRCVAARPPPPGPCDDLESVYFAFDSSALSAESRATLEKDARCITGQGTKVFRVEGNCDERGTAEYNVHLGQRRAHSVKKYLVGLGVSAQAMTAISYGKEKPVCTEHDEACWQRNRRADIKQ
jgi:peptidoglycan-associated lipoprotein